MPVAGQKIKRPDIAPAYPALNKKNKSVMEMYSNYNAKL